MIGVAYEIFDSRHNEELLKEDPSNSEIQLMTRFQGIDPGILDLFHYSFNHSGLLTGNWRFS